MWGKNSKSFVGFYNVHALSAKNVEILASLFGFLEPIPSPIVHTNIISFGAFWTQFGANVSRVT